MIIGVDLDDVLFQTTEKILEYLYNVFNIKINKEDIDTFEIGKGRDVSDKQIREAVEYAISTPSIEPVENAVKVVNMLMEEHEIIFVSHRPARLEESTLCILEDTPGLIQNWKLELTYRNYGGTPNKSAVANKYDIDIFIEDRPDTILDLYDRASCKILVFKQPWNKHIEEIVRIVKVEGWEDVIGEVNVTILENLFFEKRL